jgi:hypothetical protein
LSSWRAEGHMSGGLSQWSTRRITLIFEEYDHVDLVHGNSSGDYVSPVLARRMPVSEAGGRPDSDRPDPTAGVQGYPAGLGRPNVLGHPLARQRRQWNADYAVWSERH